MIGHTTDNFIRQLEKYFQAYVGIPFLIAIEIFYYTFSISPYWLPAMLVGKILVKLGWKVYKPKLLLSHLKSLCKRFILK